MATEKVDYKPVRVSEAWKKKDGFVFFNSYKKVILNQKQSQIWELLDGNHTIRDICQILNGFEVEEIDHFISKCVEIGFVEYLKEEEWCI